jgi:hypothetical protein
MSVLIRVNQEKGTIHEPVRLWARITDVPYELAAPVLESQPLKEVAGEWIQAIDGVKVNDLSPIWPLSHFRSVVMDAAKLFVKQMARQDAKYELLTHEGDMLVYGPYQPKSDVWTKGAEVAVGWSEGEWRRPGFADFQITGVFVAKYGRIPELRRN